MADTPFTLAQLIKINDQNLAPGVPEDLLMDTPFLAALPATPASNGTLHKYLKWTTAPTAAFRNVNAGIARTRSDDTLVTVTLEVMDASWDVDVAIADEHGNGLEAFLERESRRAIRNAFRGVEDQLINGTAADANGFAGLADALGSVGAKVQDAGDTADLTSVYLVRAADADIDLAVVLGNSGNISMSDTQATRLVDGSGNSYGGYWTNITGYVGLQLGSVHNAVRIANIGTGGTTLDDDLLYGAVKLFPAARKPTHIVMNSTAQEILRASRTATNVTGAPAPPPERLGSMEIVVSDVIGVAETQVT